MDGASLLAPEGLETWQPEILTHFFLFFKNLCDAKNQSLVCNTGLSFYIIPHQLYVIYDCLRVLVILFIWEEINSSPNISPTLVWEIITVVIGQKHLRQKHKRKLAEQIRKYNERSNKYAW